jgi:hypothetical protein
VPSLARLLIAALIALGVCRQSLAVSPVKEIPVCNLPAELRHRNYAGGSCVHASTENHFEWNGEHDLAAKWRAKYSGGESYNGLATKLRYNNIPFYATAGGGGQDVAAAGMSKDDLLAWCNRNPSKWYGTLAGDVDVLDRCTADRRGGVIFYFTNHSIWFAGFSHLNGEVPGKIGDYSFVLDNNRPESYLGIERQEFIRKWRGYGGVCVVPLVGNPRPPIPYIGSR